MSNRGPLFDIQHGECRVGNGFTKDQLGVGLDGSGDFFRRALRGDESAFHTHALQRDGNQVEAAAVDGGAGENVIAGRNDIYQSEEYGRHTGAGEHSGCAAFQSTDFLCHGIAGGIADSGIEIAVCFQIEKLGHFITGGVFISCGLNDGQLTGLTVAGDITRLYAFCADSLCHEKFLLGNLMRWSIGSTVLLQLI